MTVEVETEVEVEHGMRFLTQTEVRKVQREKKIVRLHVYYDAVDKHLRVQLFTAYDPKFISLIKNIVPWGISHHQWEQPYKSWTVRAKSFVEEMAPVLMKRGYQIDPVSLQVATDFLQQKKIIKKDITKALTAKIIVYDSWAHLYGEEGTFPASMVRNWFEKELTYYRKDYHKREKFKSGKWDGKTRLFKTRPKKNCNFYAYFRRGLLDRVKKILEALKVNYSVEDKTSTYDDYKLPFAPQWNFPHELWDHQKRIIKTCLEFHEGQIESAMGTGKSVIIARVICERGVATNVYVHRVGIAKQLFLNFSKWLGQSMVGFIGESKCMPVIGGINVISLQTAYLALQSQGFTDEITANLSPSSSDLSELRATKKRLSEEVKQNYALITAVIRTGTMSVYDEGHRLGAYTYGCTAACTLSKYNLIFTATSYRNDGADLELEAGCGPKRVSYSISQAIKDGVLMKPLVFMLYAEDEHKKVKSNNYGKEYDEHIASDLARNGIIATVATLLADSGRVGLITVRMIKHGEHLEGTLNAAAVKTKFVSGKYETDERLTYIEQLEKVDLDFIISNVMSEGIDIKPLGVLIRAKGEGRTDDNGNPSIDVVQESGRILRLCGKPTRTAGKVVLECEGKKQPILVDIFDHNKWFHGHSADREQTYRGEEEFDFHGEIRTIIDLVKFLEKEKERSEIKWM
jgi:superfamily II DNA or RNA helicase